MSEYDNLIITGSIARDEITYFDGEFKDYLKSGRSDKINISFVVDKLERHLGGTATNIAFSASLLTKQVRLYGAIGKDGQDFIDFFQENEIDTSGLIHDSEQFTSTGRVMTDNLGNQLWNFYYGAADKGKELDLGELKPSDLLIVSANHPQAIANIQDQAIKQRIDYLYDPGMSLTALDVETISRGLDHCKFFVSNEYELDMLLTKLNIGLDVLLSKGITVITTLGIQGTRLVDRSENYIIRAFPVQKVVDPSGAGDAWRGGFMYALTQNFSYREAIRFGNALASLTVEQKGAVNYHASLDLVTERSKQIP